MKLEWAIKTRPSCASPAFKETVLPVIKRIKESINGDNGKNWLPTCGPGTPQGSLYMPLFRWKIFDLCFNGPNSVVKSPC